MATQIQERTNGRIITANHNNAKTPQGLIVPTNVVLTLNVDENLHIEKIQGILTKFCERHTILECFVQYETERVNDRQIRYIFN